MRVIISAGGTGGHIYPAISIINKIKENDPKAEILYIGTTNRMEKDIVPALAINYVGLEIKGFKRSLSLDNFKTINLLRKAIKKSKKIIEDFKPDIVIGVGGYVTGPVLYAATKKKIPTLIHEQNSVPGLTNKLLMKRVDKIAVSTLDSMKFFPKGKTIYTGNPTGEDALDKKPISKEVLGLNPDKKLVLMVMGSLGSSIMTSKMEAIIPSFKNKDYEFLYVTGNGNYEKFKDIKKPKNVFVEPYIKNLSGLLKNADLFISRAGASTMSEIMALNIPTILIPSPYVTNNHQFKNAMELKDKKAAVLLEEKDVTKESLLNLIDETLEKENYQELKTNLEKIEVLRSSTMIYEEILKLTNK